VGELVDVRICTGPRAVFGDGAALVFGQAGDHPQSQSDLGLAGCVGLAGAGPLTVLNVDGSKCHLVAARVIDELHGRIEWARENCYGMFQAIRPTPGNTILDVLESGRRGWAFTTSRSLIAFLAVVSTVLDDTLYLSG
jgi:hypothetical protein